MKSMQILNLFGKTPLLNQSPERDKNIPLLFGQMLKQFVASNLAIRYDAAQSGKELKSGSVFHQAKNSGNKVLQQKTLNPATQPLADIQPKMLQKMKSFAGKLAQFIESNPAVFAKAGGLKMPSAKVLNTLFSIEEQDFTKLSPEDTIAKINQIFRTLDTGLRLEMKNNATQARELVLTSDPETNQNAFKPYFPFLTCRIAQLVDKPVKIAMPAFEKDTTLTEEVTQTPVKKIAAKPNLASQVKAQPLQTNNAAQNPVPETHQAKRIIITPNPSQKTIPQQTETIQQTESPLRGNGPKIQTEKQATSPGMKTVTDQAQFVSQKSANPAQEPTAGQIAKSPAGEPVKSGIVFSDTPQKSNKPNLKSGQNRILENTGQAAQKSAGQFEHKKPESRRAENIQPQSTQQKSGTEQNLHQPARSTSESPKIQDAVIRETQMTGRDASGQAAKSPAAIRTASIPDSVPQKKADPIPADKPAKTTENKTNTSPQVNNNTHNKPIKEKELPGKFFIKTQQESHARAAADHKPEINRQNINSGPEKVTQQKIKADIAHTQKMHAQDKPEIQSPAASKTENKTAKSPDSAERPNVQQTRSQQSADISLNRPPSDAASMKSETSRQPAGSDVQTKHQTNSVETKQPANSAGKNAEVKNIAQDKHQQQQSAGHDAPEKKTSTPSEKLTGKNSQLIDFTQQRPANTAAKSNPLNTVKLIEPIINHKIFQNPKAITGGRFRVESSPVGRMEMHYSGDQHQKSLTITVESEQAKAELAKLTPQIQDSLQQKGAEINQIKIDVGQFAGKDEQEQTRQARHQENQSNQTHFREESHEDNQPPVEKRNYGYNTIEIIA